MKGEPSRFYNEIPKEVDSDLPSSQPSWISDHLQARKPYAGKNDCYRYKVDKNKLQELNYEPDVILDDENNDYCTNMTVVLTCLQFYIAKTSKWSAEAQCKIKGMTHWAAVVELSFLIRPPNRKPGDKVLVKTGTARRPILYTLHPNPCQSQKPETKDYKTIALHLQDLTMMTP